MKKRFAMILSTLMIAVFCLLSVSAFAGFDVTTTERLNLRTAPGTQFATQGLLSKGKTLTVSETAKDSKGVTWYRVSNNGKTGWICSSFAKQDAKNETKKDTKQSATVKSLTVKLTGNANLRAGAGVNYATIGVTSKGAKATFLNASALDDHGVVWFKINYNGKIGWVSSEYAVLK